MNSSISLVFCSFQNCIHKFTRCLVENFLRLKSYVSVPKPVKLLIPEIRPLDALCRNRRAQWAIMQTLEEQHLSNPVFLIILTKTELIAVGANWNAY